MEQHQKNATTARSAVTPQPQRSWQSWHFHPPQEPQWQRAPGTRGRAGSSSHHFQQPLQGGTNALILLYREMLPLRGLPMTFLCLRAHVLFEEGLLRVRHAPLSYQRGNFMHWMQAPSRMDPALPLRKQQAQLCYLYPILSSFGR